MSRWYLNTPSVVRDIYPIPYAPNSTHRVLDEPDEKETLQDLSVIVMCIDFLLILLFFHNVMQTAPILLGGGA